MKNLLLVLAGILIFATACKKEKSTGTMLNVQVVDSAGRLVPGITVYKMTAEKYATYGPNPVYRDEANTTDMEGVVTFIIPDAEFLSTNTVGFAVFAPYQVRKTNKVATSTVKIQKGEIVNKTLLVN